MKTNNSQIIVPLTKDNQLPCKKDSQNLNERMIHNIELYVNKACNDKLASKDKACK